eukprot:TRINITY_DN8482_c0_g3_i1.p1 TRINITY_DN8482_c0_g3~~TRINITY_DN8482_c0_g3_i1.p1  ORF type:complete len:270 (-),score=39.73 TRINITY_DN8482_c0_g3_i1:681-1490(-)
MALAMRTVPVCSEILAARPLAVASQSRPVSCKVTLPAVSLGSSCNQRWSTTNRQQLFASRPHSKSSQAPLSRKASPCASAVSEPLNLSEGQNVSATPEDFHIAEETPKQSPSASYVALAALALPASLLLSTSLHSLFSSLAAPLFAIRAAAMLAQSRVASNVLSTVAPLCFAAVSASGQRVSTPMTVIASGMARWLELYSGVLLCRVLLTWFPNIDWERQPMQAIRDMTDPYLNLFRNILPPAGGVLDLSPLLAFMVLGFLMNVLSASM